MIKVNKLGSQTFSIQLLLSSFCAAIERSLQGKRLQSNSEFRIYGKEVESFALWLSQPKCIFSAVLSSLYPQINSADTCGIDIVKILALRNFSNEISNDCDFLCYICVSCRKLSGGEVCVHHTLLPQNTGWLVITSRDKKFRISPIIGGYCSNIALCIKLRMRKIQPQEIGMATLPTFVICYILSFIADFKTLCRVSQVCWFL